MATVRKGIGTVRASRTARLPGVMWTKSRAELDLRRGRPTGDGSAAGT